MTVLALLALPELSPLPADVAAGRELLERSPPLWPQRARWWLIFGGRRRPTCPAELDPASLELLARSPPLWRIEPDGMVAHRRPRAGLCAGVG